MRFFSLVSTFSIAITIACTEYDVKRPPELGAKVEDVSGLPSFEPEGEVLGQGQQSGDASQKPVEAGAGGVPDSLPAPPVDPIAALHKSVTSCVGCHAKDRPAPPHPADGDCVSCHKFPSFAGVSAFAHLPKPAACEACHARPKDTGNRAYPNQGPPTGFDPKNPLELGSGHYVGKDCVSCHQTPAEGAKAFSFDHPTPRVTFCLPCHFDKGASQHQGSARVNLSAFGNCAGCHNSFNNWD